MTGEKLVEVYSKIKRTEFLSALIREKNEGIASLTAEAAELRKKNGRALKSDIDLLIYQINMKISAQQKSVAACKEEIRTLRSESGELLMEIYPEIENDDERKLVLTAMDKVYLGKAKLTSAEDEGGIFGNCDIVGAVTTQDKRRKVAVSRLVKAGIKTDMGKTLSAPQIEVYDYDPKAEEGVRREENNSFKKVLARRAGREKGPIGGYFAELFANAASVVALISVVIAFAALAFTGANEAAVTGAKVKEILLKQAVMTGAFAAIASLLTLKSAKRGGAADVAPIASTFMGIILLVCYFVYPTQGFGLAPALIALGYGVAFTAARIAIPAEEKNNGEIRTLSAVFLGGTLAYFFRAVYLVIRTTAQGRTWGYLVLGVIALCYAVAGIFWLIGFKKDKITTADGLVVSAATFFGALAFTLPAVTYKTALLWVAGGACFVAYAAKVAKTGLSG